MEQLIFRVVVMPILFWTAIGGCVALAIKLIAKRPTMPIWPMVPFLCWGIVRAAIRAWHAFS
ncbi:hypothetical protein [Sphingomonas faeni]|uniref:hypothetical protein n=1 Tax=Sphingomonas faeni TaxID=185950 RepID=UPI003364BFA4